jgi:hypothetical protein
MAPLVGPSARLGERASTTAGLAAAISLPPPRNRTKEAP